MFTAMTPSQWLWDFLQRPGNEGPLATKAYKPTPDDVWTIGYGHTRGVMPTDTCTADQADAWLQNDVAGAVIAVCHLVDVPLAQAQFDALVSLVFNIGAGNFQTSTLLRKLNARDYAGAAEEFPKWNHQAGHVLDGLTTRRDAEQARFLSAEAM